MGRAEVGEGEGMEERRGGEEVEGSGFLGYAGGRLGGGGGGGGWLRGGGQGRGHGGGAMG